MDQTDRDNWRRADEILDALLDVPAEQRSTHLLALNLSPELRARVDSLLAALDRTDGVLDQPGSLPLAPMPDALDGRRLGRWLLGEEIGRGGMAVVYRAQSMEGPTGQKAAIKVLTMGALAATGADRFLHEQRALLRLRHAYIATLYDAGVADDGTAWLAMALVEGEPIDAWCERHDLGISARIRLLLQVGDALAYAHRNLVIHRDIKPSNVLIDDEGHVHLLDFGIARCVDAIDADSERTVTLLRLLTPGYAAPEQFAGDPPSTAMDVFGLGALLYRLLTGVAPRSGMDDTQPITAPSRRTHAEAGAKTDAQRQWRKRLRGDLDAIVLKALATEPEARYPGVDTFCRDLKRWLDGKPVKAQPPSLRYRLGKLVARNKLAVAASAALLLAILGGVAATLWQAREARQQAMLAQRSAEQSQAQLNYLQSVFDVLAPATAATRELDRHTVIAEAGARAVAELSGRPRLLASVEISLGKVASKVGNYQQALALFKNALQRRRTAFGNDSSEYAEALLYLGTVTDKVEPSQPALAESRIRKALEVLQQRGADDRLIVEALVEYGSQLAGLARYDKARGVLQQASRHCAEADKAHDVCDRVWRELGGLARRTNHDAQAVDAFKRLLALRLQRYGKAHAATAFATARLGHALLRAGEQVRGLTLLEQALELQQRTGATHGIESLQTLCDLGEAYAAVGRSEEAMALFKRFLTGVRELLGERSSQYAYGLSQIGSLYHRLGHYAEAAEAYRRSQAIHTALSGEQSGPAAFAMGRRADALYLAGQLQDALPLAERSLKIQRTIFGETAYRTGVRWTHLGNLLLALGRHRDALAAFSQAKKILSQPPMTDLERQRGFVASSQASRALLALGQAQAARAEAIAAWQQAEASDNHHSSFYATTLANAIVVVCEVGPPAECAAIRGKANLRDPALLRAARTSLESALQATAEADKQGA